MGYSQAAIFGVSLSFPVLGLLLVGVRFWMRRHFKKSSLGMDDWTILFASILVVGMGVNFIVGSYRGLMGMDGQPTIESRVATQTKIDYAMLVFEKPAYGAIKLSVLFFYRRIFTIVPTFRVVNNCLIALIITWTLAFWLGDILNCGAHPEANWDPTLKAKTHCINLYGLLLAFAVTDVLTDMAILWMPYPQIKRLQMDLKERWALAGIFALGTLDLLIGIVRLGFIIANQTIPAVKSHFNPPESTAPTFWTVVEVGIGVIAANLPALAPLFKQRTKLASSLSSFREGLLSKFGKTASRNESAVGPRMSLHSTPSAGEVLVGKFKTSKEHREDSVGAWDQFEIMDNLSAGELGTRRAMVHAVL